MTNPESLASPLETQGMLFDPVAQHAGRAALVSEGIIDLRTLIPEAQGGDETAVRALYALHSRS